MSHKNYFQIIKIQKAGWVCKTDFNILLFSNYMAFIYKFYKFEKQINIIIFYNSLKLIPLEDYSFESLP